jgi:DNA-binding helix-hairpin-helix protein with protein kinase domain
MTPRILYDNRNQRIELGPQLGVGGEGAVYEVSGQSALVAKVYHKPPDTAKDQKLRAMVALAHPDLLQVAAWPTATLHQSPSGPLAGILMPKVAGHKEVHTLYSPAHRKKDFPTADWSFLIQTAMNCAIAFDAIHRGGHTIGDVNQSNVLVSSRAVVRLIDCDSYQIASGGHTFLCEVGVPLYTPPELQGQSFRGVTRTPNHDRFGLAVLIFHLLFVGRHPFSGRPLGPGDLPIEKAIKEFRFAFSRAAAQFQVAPPPHAPLLGIVPAELGRLFERAFSNHSSKSDARPTAQEWSTSLVALQKQLKTCSTDAGHRFSSHLNQCCWCELVRTGAPNYFISVTVYRVGSTIPSLTFVLGPEWAEVERVSRPNSAYRRPALPPGMRIVPTALPAHIPASVPAAVLVYRDSLHRTLGWTAAGLAVLFPLIVLMIATATRGSAAGEGRAVAVGFGVFTLLSLTVLGGWWVVLELLHRHRGRSANAERNAILGELSREENRRLTAYQRAVADLDNNERELRHRLAVQEHTFDELKRKLELLKSEYLGLKVLYDHDHRELEKNKEAAQLEVFLQTQFISNHDIAGIGPTREAVLRSNNIETAHDIDPDRVQAINGFGPKLTQALLDWRHEVSRKFRFNASATLPPAELAALVVKYKGLQQRKEASMRGSLAELKQCSDNAARQRSSLSARIQQLVIEVAQTNMDLQVLPVDGV